MYALIYWRKGETKLPMRQRRVYLHSEGNFSEAELYETRDDAALAIKYIAEEAEQTDDMDYSDSEFRIINLDAD